MTTNPGQMNEKEVHKIIEKKNKTKQNFQIYTQHATYNSDLVTNKKN